MNKIRLTVCAAGSLLLSIAFSTGAHAGDDRTLVTLPEMMRQHMLGNMRDHLMALEEISRLLSEHRFGQAADVAETRLGMSSLDSHGAEHMAAFMPEPMREIGTNMHRAASRFATAAQEAAVEDDPGPLFSGLSQVMQQCVACHSNYRVH